MQPMSVHLVNLFSVPLQARSYLVADSEPKRPGPQLISIVIHSKCIIFFYVRHKLLAKNLVVLNAAQGHNASVRAL